MRKNDKIVKRFKGTIKALKSMRMEIDHYLDIDKEQKTDQYFDDNSVECDIREIDEKAEETQDLIDCFLSNNALK